jgi:hypothetical protein
LVDREDHGDDFSGFGDLALHQAHVVVLERQKQHLELALICVRHWHEASLRGCGREVGMFGSLKLVGRDGATPWPTPRPMKAKVGEADHDEWLGGKADF